MQVDRDIFCTVCASSDVLRVLEIENIPVFCNIQWPDRASALEASKGHIALGFCEQCSHIFNYRFDPELVKYSGAYENSLHFSPRFQDFAERLTTHLIDKYSLTDKTIIDVGCGKGEFLSMLCESGNNRGFGFDTSYEADRSTRAESTSVTFIKDFFDENYSDLEADFLCCRHVLEHIVDPVNFLKGIHRALSGNRGSSVYFEVPNVLYSIDDLGIWDFIYEHCSYFCVDSVAQAFGEAGFDVHEIYTEFENQFLCVEASANSQGAGGRLPSGQLQTLNETVAEFKRSYDKKIGYWNTVMLEAKRGGKSAAIWGAGSKGVTFLNCIENTDVISMAVDLNPNKEGKFVSGTGHKIVNPSQLHLDPPDFVVVMNSIYRAEIESLLTSMGIDAPVLCA